MIKDFVVNVTDLTKGVAEQGFGLILVVDNELDIPYQVITSASDLNLETVTPSSKVYKMVQKIFMASPAPAEVAVFGDSQIIDETDLIASLDGLIDDNKGDWFFLTSTMNDSDTLAALANWATANDKLYFATAQDVEAINNIESANAAIGYHHLEEDYFAEGLAANLAVADAGSITGKFQEVSGSLPANVSLTDLKELHSNNGFSYVKSMGRSYVSEGKMSDGTYMDIALGSYFIKFRLEEALFLLAMNNGKIPYSDAGIAMIIAEVENVLRVATRQGIVLERDGRGVYEIDALERGQVLPNDIANRVYNGVNVRCVVAGAIHSAEININLVLTEGDDE